MPKLKQKEATLNLNPEDVPEVAEFLETERRMYEFVHKYQELFDNLAQLVEDRNTALEAADSAVRSMCITRNAGVKCGPFRFKHFSERINGEAMFDALGADEFQKLGGSIKTVPQYVADKAMVLKSIRTGEISPAKARMFYQKTPVYMKIERVYLP